MEDTFKRLLYAGVGLAAEASAKIEEEIDKLVEKGKMSETEGKKVVDDFISKSEEAKTDFDSKFKDFVEKFGYTKAEDLATLKKRIEELEAKLATK